MYQCLFSQHASEELGQGLLVVIFPNLGSIAMRQMGNVGKKIWDKRDETSCCVTGTGFVRNLSFVFERPKIGVIFPAQTCHIWWKATQITRWFLSIFSAHAAQTYVLLLKFNLSVLLKCLVVVEGGGEKYEWLKGFPTDEEYSLQLEKYKDEKRSALAYRVNSADNEEAISGLSK